MECGGQRCSGGSRLGQKKNGRGKFPGRFTFSRYSTTYCTTRFRFKLWVGADVPVPVEVTVTV